MSQKDKKQEGELSEQQLDGIAGGQQVVSMGKITVEAKRPAPKQDVVKMDTIVVTAQREKPDAAGVRVAGVDTKTRKN